MACFPLAERTKEGAATWAAYDHCNPGSGEGGLNLKRDHVKTGKWLILIHEGRAERTKQLQLGRIASWDVGQIFQGVLSTLVENRHIKHTSALKWPNSLLNHRFNTD